MGEHEPKEGRGARAPLVVWRVMFGVALAALALLVWSAIRNTTDPPTLVVTGDEESSEWAEPFDSYVTDPGSDELTPAEGSLDHDTAEHDTGELDTAELDALDTAGPGAPITTEAPSAPEPASNPEPAGDPGVRLAELRELIRLRTEAESEELQGDSDGESVPELLIDELITVDGAYEEELSPASTGPSYTVEEPWDYALRLHLATALMLLLAFLLAFVARREGEPLYGFAGASLAVLSGGWLVYSFLPAEGSAVSVVMSVQAPTMHFGMVAFALLALTARRRGWLLAALIVGVDLGSSILWDSQVHQYLGDWAGMRIVPLAASAMPWMIVAMVFAERAKASSARPMEPQGGPYRSGPLSPAPSLAGASLWPLVRLFWAWFGIQLLCFLRPAMSWDPLTLSSYVVAADLGVATLITLQARNAPEGSQRRRWRLMAMVLWTLLLVSAFAHAAAHSRSYGAAAGLVPVGALTALRVLSAIGAGAAIGLFLQSLHASARARLGRADAPLNARPSVMLGAAALGAAALRWLATSPSGADLTDWLVLAGFVGTGGASFARLTRGLRDDPEAMGPTRGGEEEE